MQLKKLLIPAVAFVVALSFKPFKEWQSKFVHVNQNGSLEYFPDEKGDVLPDFSRVGYYGGDRAIPDVPVVKTIEPAASGSSESIIQSAIDELSNQPLKSGSNYRGTILLKKGVYVIPNQLSIQSSGIVLRGEGEATKLIAAGNSQRALIKVTGKGSVKEIPGTRTRVTDAFVAVGTHALTLESAAAFRVGDKIMVYRPGTDQWIRDLKMDQIEARNGTKQWEAKEYNLQYERVITRIEGNKIYLDNPIVMEMETKYGGAEVYKYEFGGRISDVGIENLYCESEYEKDTSENHSWEAINFDKIQNGWVRNVTARHFAYSCVTLEPWARNITVTQSGCFDHKSVITGGRRYSFCNNGQLNLFTDCQASDGRHDYVTGARVCGPNVFVNCTAKNTHADIGPHHRWSSGTLYDNIQTDGEINIQDRGNYGSGHGWVGITQILWNCTAKTATVQSPYVNGNNYSIGLKGNKGPGRFKDRPDGVWEGQNQEGLQPRSLYYAQLKARQAEESKNGKKQY